MRPDSESDDDDWPDEPEDEVAEAEFQEMRQLLNERARAWHAEQRQLQQVQGQQRDELDPETLQALRQINACTCPMGFGWNKVFGGYQCTTANHFVSDAELLERLYPSDPEDEAEFQELLQPLRARAQAWHAEQQQLQQQQQVQGHRHAPVAAQGREPVNHFPGLLALRQAPRNERR
eukprot:TRINITY_DN4718_c0_g1_i2.p1 TRINITY_DN4718_c0_g1~~TRINITY_DN4718_c0_g1_i2.p1  ORF type:complete len:177 (+),score=30.43 TRINITY_DN4718_c0_g1_i2:92-622(+)